MSTHPRRAVAPCVTEIEQRTSQDTGRIVRDAILCALQDAGQPLTPKQVARKTQINVSYICLWAKRWKAYFTTECDREQGRGYIKSIDLHPHLKQSP
jgi:hypothetical protein